ncbi:hybrid-cluster NAD(P)-dependent oxidoreductase [Pseudonocardia sp. DSM 110487]|uniref:hybrid-cluster NAD(P)-dependent oxidoreductase n=1 Tax=Pseudonocardia sp. DSM 110487 TaxID=2865833 RepID=UPI001C6A7F8D|nr:hybrid-cluster NAD(P)-dependent oxidoreductase [Pseudonocardia sp. DSM 110487]QYN33753.1 hybrid-cluster NAD(P)-dependent oxidoreductase [Pseudonocardia sp. DSM 110487]
MTEMLLTCKQVHTITADVRTFVFEVAGSEQLRFDAGQYLTVTTEPDGIPVTRCYTISSPPTRPRRIAITVKRVPGGLVSNWLHDHLTPGGTLRASGPQGQFSVARHPAPKYLFLSGGSGVTPSMSMTRTLYDLADPADVLFVHSARTPDDIIFRRELDLIAATVPHIRVVHVCEENGPVESWGGYRGRLDLAMLRQIAPDLLEREIFACGPPGYVEAVRLMLPAAGFDMARYHEELFTVPAPAPANSNGGGSFKVELTRSGRTIACDSETAILTAAAQEGITLPASCAQGMCGTCKTTLVAGTVNMRHNGGIRPREIAQNKILLCCSTPLEDVVIDA